MKLAALREKWDFRYGLVFASVSHQLLRRTKKWSLDVHTSEVCECMCVGKCEYVCQFGLLATLIPNSFVCISLPSLCITRFYRFTLWVDRGWLLYHDPTCRLSSLLYHSSVMCCSAWLSLLLAYMYILPTFFVCVAMQLLSLSG